MIGRINYPSFEIPAVLKEKAVYMQSPEFLNDPHNKKMFELGEQLGQIRDEIADEVRHRNQSGKEEVVQGINGFARIKKYLERNFKMNFWEEQTFHSPAENKYNFLKKYQIGNLARQARAKLPH